MSEPNWMWSFVDANAIHLLNSNRCISLKRPLISDSLIVLSDLAHMAWYRWFYGAESAGLQLLNESTFKIQNTIITQQSWVSVILTVSVCMSMSRVWVEYTVSVWVWAVSCRLEGLPSSYDKSTVLFGPGLWTPTSKEPPRTWWWAEGAMICKLAVFK